MRICIDLDGVICELRKPDQTYEELLPLPGAIEALRSLKARGHYLIIYTARHMKTCDSNEGLVLKKIGEVTLKWLSINKIVYDEIYFGKPWAEVYIDDNAKKFEDWPSLIKNLK